MNSLAYPPDLDRWRAAARISAKARELGISLAVPGASRRAIADRVEGFIRSQGAEPAFPANLSRNVEAAHYTPSREDEEVLQAGDLLKVDVGAHLDGAIADTAATVEVGGGQKFATLRRAVEEALRAGIAQVQPGVSVDRIGSAVEAAAHRYGLKPIRDLSGHTIQRYLLHAGKSIPNVGGLSTVTLEEGEVVAIEPFVTNGAGRIANGPFGNIQRFREDPGPSDPRLAALFARFRTLPFTLRWVDDEEDRKRLRRARRWLQTYPVFEEAGGGVVAQMEHTVLVGPQGAELLTALTD
ncbi:MAG: type II methionyl aminopeptidase [Thermoplasmata archaeon]|nr:type II methionyl aminopeptidase [Thermoplasmata archaeon]MCI4340888.1 type II methionyl aminopeptidase [Thermoplasmata archaeon]